MLEVLKAKAKSNLLTRSCSVYSPGSSGPLSFPSRTPCTTAGTNHSSHAGILKTRTHLTLLRITSETDYQKIGAGSSNRTKFCGTGRFGPDTAHRCPSSRFSSHQTCRQSATPTLFSPCRVEWRRDLEIKLFETQETLLGFDNMLQ